MRHEEFSRSVRYDFRINLSARSILRPLIPEALPNQITVIDWWTWYTEAESGAWDTGDTIALVNGPLNPQRSTNVSAVTIRDNEDFRALVLGHPSGGIATDPVGVTAAVGHPFMAFPRGLMTAQEVFVMVEVGTGVLRCSVTAGYHIAHVTRAEWIWACGSALNTERKGDLIS